MNCGSQEFDAMPNGAARCRYCGNMIQGVYRPAPSGIEQQFNNMGSNLQTGKKDKWIAILLAFFLGWLGAQYFYLGDTTKGIICVAIVLLLGWFFFIGLLITGIWSLISFIMLLAMSDQQFDEKYNSPRRK